MFCLSDSGKTKEYAQIIWSVSLIENKSKMEMDPAKKIWEN